MRLFEGPLTGYRSEFRHGRSRVAAAAALTCVLLSGRCAAADSAAIYLIEDSSGAVHLANRLLPDEQRAAVPIAGEAPRRLVPQASGVPGIQSISARRNAIAGIVAAAAASQRLDPQLLEAIIAVESAYAPRAVSPRGALGLMQLLPPTAKDYSVTDPFDPRQNIFAGASHLRVLLDRFGGDTTLALAAYNAGAAAVSRYLPGLPPYSETIAYVPKVLGRLAELRREPLP